jgi:hypothetical protein
MWLRRLPLPGEPAARRTGLKIGDTLPSARSTMAPCNRMSGARSPRRIRPGWRNRSPQSKPEKKPPRPKPAETMVLAALHEHRPLVFVTLDGETLEAVPTAATYSIEVETEAERFATLHAWA